MYARLRNIYSYEKKIKNMNNKSAIEGPENRLKIKMRKNVIVCK